MMQPKTPEEKRLLELLLDVVVQSCSDSTGTTNDLDSMACSAYSEAMFVLAEYGLLTISKHYGRRVIANIVSK